MSINRIFGLTPVNRGAALVTSQYGVAQEDLPMGRDELLSMLKLMERKSRLLKRVLNINTHAQHKNSTRQFKKGRESNFRDSRALAEYTRLGSQMQIFYRRISEIQAAAKKDRALAKKPLRLIDQKMESARAVEGIEKHLRGEVIRRDGWKCTACSAPDNLLATRIDAANPPAQVNLQTVCLPCWTLKNGNDLVTQKC